MIKLAFPYYEKNYFLSGEHTDNCMYYFFMKRLKEHPDLDVYYFKYNEGDKVDCQGIEKFADFDALLFYSPHKKFNPPMQGMEALDIPKFAMSPDCHNYYSMAKEMASYGEDVNYFYTTSEDYFYQYVPKNYKYKQIVIGIDVEAGYIPLTHLDYRETERILLTGIIPRLGTVKTDHYKLRRMCRDTKHVKYMEKGEYVGNRYARLLMTHRAAISASTHCFTLRHLEVALAGCVPFLEITEQNGGRTLGYTDEKNAIFINEENYKERFDEYRKTRHDKKWTNLALRARDFVKDRYTCEHGVDKLVKYIKENL